MIKETSLSCGEPSLTAFDGLQLLFIGLKLGGVIGWSWWAVMSPMIATAVLAFASVTTFAVVSRRK